MSSTFEFSNEVEFLDQWLSQLRASGKAIIVEGSSDKRVLENFGVKHIFTLRRALFEVIEEVANSYSEVVILTDFDKAGKALYGRLVSGLQDNGVKIDRVFREALYKETQLHQIEGLVRYYERRSRELGIAP